MKKLDLISDKNFNLDFDRRIFDIEQQTKNGIQITLIKMENNNKNTLKLKRFNMDIHCDLILDTLKSSVWNSYDVDWDNIREIEYLGIKTWAPSEENTHMLLYKEYGNYKKKNHKPYSIDTSKNLKKYNILH